PEPEPIPVRTRRVSSRLLCCSCFSSHLNGIAARRGLAVARRDGQTRARCAARCWSPSPSRSLPCSRARWPRRRSSRSSPSRLRYVQHCRPQVEAPPPAPVAPAPPPPPPPEQRVLVRGRLREKGTRDPIAGAAVSLVTLEAIVPQELYGSTDDEGRFQIAGSVDAGVRLRVVVSTGEHEACIREVDAPAPGAPAPEVNCLVLPHPLGHSAAVV